MLRIDSGTPYQRVTSHSQERASEGVPRAQVALAWPLHKPGVTSPIVGATKPHHLTDAVAALGMRLTDDEIRRLDEPYRPHAVAGIGVGR